jgi:hypothetical protein
VVLDLYQDEAHTHKTTFFLIGIESIDFNAFSLQNEGANLDNNQVLPYISLRDEAHTYL